MSKTHWKNIPLPLVLIHIIALLDHHSTVAFSAGPSVESLQTPTLLKNDVTTRGWNTTFFPQTFQSNTYLTLKKLQLLFTL